jgi:hypothetical protein
VTLLLHICQWLAGTVVATRIRESDNLFSVIETAHVLGIMLTAGTIAIVDLRILGLLLERYSVQAILTPLVRLTWIGFSIMASSGLLLFWSEADKLYYNWAFRLKLTLLLMAGVNQWLFSKAHHQNMAVLSAGVTVPHRAKLAAALSLVLWAGIIVLGRAIAYL